MFGWNLDDWFGVGWVFFGLVAVVGVGWRPVVIGGHAVSHALNLILYFK